MTASAPSWEALIIAALGSSAAGAIIGGYITTRLRGRIERDEAWRTRLIEAADEFLPQMRRSADALAWRQLVTIEQGHAALRTPDGGLVPDAARAVADYKHERDILLPLLERVYVLYGVETSQIAMRLLRNLDTACALLEGERWVEDAARAKLGDVRESLEIADSVKIPNRFDRRNDTSVAWWARILLESAAEYHEKLADSCMVRIHARQPGEISVPRQ